MENKELIIDKPSDLFNILNRKEYTKLILNCEVNPKLLNGFDNIKELTISSEKIVDKHINEYYINSYSFKDNLKKITFININSFGYFYKRTRKNKYNCTDKISLKCSNLKKICFILPENNYKLNFYGYYLKELENLEELEIDTLLGFRIADTIYCKNSLKRVNVKLSKLNKEYTFELLYPIYCISSLCFSESHKNLNLDYYGKNVNTYVKTDVLTDKQTIKTIFNEITDKSIINNSLYIPDYVTKISFDNINYYEKIEDISFNINLLNSIEDKSKITDNTYLELLKTITIRNTNEMSLFSEKVINVNDVGTLEKLYIEDHKLYMVYDKEIIIVDSEGIITKETIGKKEEPKLDVKSEKKIEFDLDKYSINELEEYLLYRKFLESIKDNNDKELTDAVNIVGNKLVKKLNKGESYE